jgi:GMP synthase-like glutamine amidotransferase
MTTSRRVLVVTHDPVTPSDSVGEHFEARGYEVIAHPVVPAASYHSPGVTTSFPMFDTFDAVVLMGAPWSTYDRAAIGSWVLDELEQLRLAVRAGVPVLGICFGGQLLAEAHGGSVVRSARPEIGWYDVASSAPEIIPDGPWFQWHQDTWILPPSAREIARNDNASQAFVTGRSLAVQFHPELTSTMLTGWLAAGGALSARVAGLDPDTLVDETVAHDARSRTRARALVDGFLDQVASAPPPRSPSS